MSTIRSDPASVQALAQLLSDPAGIPAAHLEKDLYVTEALRVMARHASECRYELVLKGGTSLSKGHRLISRFSEDIDVLLVFTSEGIGTRETAMKDLLFQVQKQLGVELNHDPARSPGKKRGFHRAAEFGWETGTAARSGTSPYVLIELGTEGGLLPNSVLSLTPLVAEWAGRQELPFEYDEAESFEIRVMSPVRTLAEKLMLVHTAATDPETAENRRRAAARHYYDVYCLLSDEGVRTELGDQMPFLAAEIDTHSRAADRPSVRRPHDGFASSDAFDAARSQIVRDEYESTVIASNGLVWPGATVRPEFDDCLSMVKLHRAIL